ncbi:TLC domain-containing protein 2-like [Acropora millepora]|uniref:TLC domain-containing protein 2-like n=1 Tax=Acropora millepora TaxID=45264 RepID=UPI001CF1D470|nr:TLC domain-containing protein 2-like [Acropora millepora]
MSLGTQYFYLMMFALVSLLAFRVVCIALKSTISPPNVVSSTKEWLYFNTLISFLHACISGLSSIYCFVDHPQMFQNMTKGCSLPSMYLLTFLVGYTLYDTLDIVVHDFIGSPGIIIHHVVIITVAVFVLYTRQFIPFATSLCVIEFNSVFLHLRRLMRFHGISRSQFTYRLNLVALFGTYIALRFVFLVLLTAYFVYFRHKTYFSYFLLGFSGYVVLIAINLILFFRLWKTEFAVKTTMNGECCNGHVQEKHD